MFLVNRLSCDLVFFLPHSRVVCPCYTGGWFLEDVLTPIEAFERLHHLLLLHGERLRHLLLLHGERLHHLLLHGGSFLEDVLTPIEAFERLPPLLLRRTQDRGKIFRDTDLRRSGGQGASTFVVTRSFAK